jgi:ankyrin repeat protein
MMHTCVRSNVTAGPECRPRRGIIAKGILIVALCLFLSLPSIAQSIHAAVYAGDMEKVKSLLMEDPLLINREDRNGRTPLFFAVLSGNTDMAEFLITQGALVRVGDHNLRAPIHMAGFMDDIEMAGLLLKNGAVVDTRAIGAATPLIHSSLTDRVKFSRFLIEQGADLNVQCNSLTTPLYFASLNNNIDFLNYLLELGADLDTPDFLGRTPLSIAVRDGFSVISEALIKRGADRRVTDPFLDRSLLHLAAIQGRLNTAGQLVRAGLEVNAKDGKGFTPLDYARSYGHAALAEFLLKEGGRADHISSLEGTDPSDFKDIEPGEAVIVKLRNGSWGIVTEGRFLILAYSEIGVPPQDPSLRSGYLTGQELTGYPWFYFDLSFRPASASYALQGRNPLYARTGRRDAVTCILNETYDRNYAALNLARAFYPKSGEPLDIEDLKVTIVPSYQAKKGFLITCDGLTLFWLAGLSDDYLSAKSDDRALEFVKARVSSVDLLFLGLPDGIGPEKGNGIRESYLKTRTLNPGAVFFMGKEPLARRVRSQILRRIPDPGNIFCAENPGDRVIYTRGTLKR